MRELLDVDDVLETDEVERIILDIADQLEERQKAELGEWTLSEEQKSAARLQLVLDRRNEETISESTDIPAYMRTIMHQYPVLTEEEERILSYHIQTRDGEDPLHKQSVEKLMYSNFRFVFFFLQKLMGITMKTQDRDDLIQQGLLALAKAAQRYDARIGRFSTYAEWWIRQHVYRERGNYGATIRVPIHKGQAARRIRKALIEFSGHEPPFSDQEIGDFCEAKNIAIAGVQEALRITSM